MKFSRLKNWLTSKNKFSVLFFVLASFMIAPIVRAGATETIIQWVLLPITGIIIPLEGMILSLLIRLLLWIISYSGFTTSSAVTMGWTLVRDTCNLFFVVIILAIAIATILRLESYALKRALPKFLIMAVLINFSLVICGLFIDFGNFVMFTFAAGFEGVAGEGKLVQVLHLKEIITVKNEAGQTATNYIGFAVSAVLMMFLLLVTIVVVFVILIVFIMRIVMLWLLIVLSPASYLMAAWPGKRAQSYYNQWWDDFIKYVTVGPVLAFFLWLTFAIAGNTANNADSFGLGVDTIGADTTDSIDVGDDLLEAGSTLTSSTATPASSLLEITDPSKMISFIIAIGMLLGSLMLTQQLGVAGGQMAGTAAGKLKSMGTAPLTGGLKLGGIGAKWVGRNVADRGFRAAQRAVLTKTGGFGKFFTGESKREKNEKQREDKFIEIEKRFEVEKKQILAPIEQQEQQELTPVNTQLSQVDIELKQLKSAKESGVVLPPAGEFRIIDLEKQQGDLEQDKKTIEEKYKSQRIEKLAPIENLKEEAVSRVDKEIPVYNKGYLRKGFAQVSKFGITGNPAMWYKGFNDWRGRKTKEYEAGLGGGVHDFLSLMNVWGSEKTTFSKQEEMSLVNEKRKQSQDETQGETDQSLNKLDGFIKSNDRAGIAGEIQNLASEGDQNEILKGKWAEEFKPIIEEGLNKFYLGKTIKTFDPKTGKTTEKIFDKKDLKDVMDHYKTDGSVNPAFMNLFTRTVLTKAYGGNEDLAASQAKIIADLALKTGQVNQWGGQNYNSEKQEIEFSPLELVLKTDGQGNQTSHLDVGLDIQKAVAGKLQNIQFRKYMASMHPDTLGQENDQGGIEGLGEVNKMILVKQINKAVLSTVFSRGQEFRADILNKPVASQRWREEILDFANQLENNQDVWERYGLKDRIAAKSQAQLIRDLPRAMATALGKTEETRLEPIIRGEY